MKISSAKQFVEDVLKDGFWHTTSRARFSMITQDGALKVEPRLPDSARHKTTNGAINYPFVRTLGGVSLFNFTGFDSDAYQARYPLSNWQAFVPLWHGWDKAVWIEIDETICRPNIVKPNELIDRWLLEQAYGHTIMPLIEAAHIGDVPMGAFRSSLLVMPTKAGEWQVNSVQFKACQSAPAQS